MRPNVPCTSLLVAATLASTVEAPPARACGGGLVTVPGSTVTSGSQLALLSHRAATETTDVVVRINVPAAAQPFGVLIPLSSTQQPTIDPAPIAAAAFDVLDVATRPELRVPGGDHGSHGAGFGCSAEPTRAFDGGAPSGAVLESPPVTVGPVVAQYVLADDQTALLAWLTDNGYALPEGGDAIAGSYIAAGAGFLAFKRADDAPSSDPVSLGVHFTVPGDLRSVALRMVQLGAPDVLPMTFFVAAADAVGPAAPWRGILVDDLVDAAFDYAAAIDLATAEAPAGQLFVFETVSRLADLGDTALDPLRALVDENAVVSRLSARLPREALASDVAFTGPRPASREPASAAALRLPRSVDLPLLALGLGLALLRRHRR
jgi:hypothetical protein